MCNLVQVGDKNVLYFLISVLSDYYFHETYILTPQLHILGKCEIGKKIYEVGERSRVGGSCRKCKLKLAKCQASLRNNAPAVVFSVTLFMN